MIGTSIDLLFATLKKHIMLTTKMIITQTKAAIGTMIVQQNK